MTLKAEHNFLIDLIRKDFNILQIKQLNFSALN